MKKIICVMLAAALLLSLAACGSKDATPTETVPVCERSGHSWVEASCAAAKTCSVCGETEGTALNHSWVEASCAAAKTCSVCGETEGTALVHSWKDANYQAPKTCTVCGAAEGEALTATFEEKGLAINITEVGKEYDYVTTCYEDTTKKTVGKLKISNYRVFDGDETHPALEGYEWHAVTVTILFNDENAWNYGMSVRVSCDNYYDPIGWDDSQTKISDGIYTQTCNYNGVSYECTSDFSEKMNFSGWIDRENTCSFNRYVRVPVGYDGVVLTFRDHSLTWEDGQYIYDVVDENALFFRLDGKGAEYAK